MRWKLRPREVRGRDQGGGGGHGGAGRASRHPWLASFWGGRTFSVSCPPGAPLRNGRLSPRVRLSSMGGPPSARARLCRTRFLGPPSSAPQTGWRSSPVAVYTLPGGFGLRKQSCSRKPPCLWFHLLAAGSLGSQTHPPQPIHRFAGSLPQHVLTGQCARCVTFPGPSPPPMHTAPAAWMPSDPNTSPAPAPTTLPSITFQNPA